MSKHLPRPVLATLVALACVTSLIAAGCGGSGTAGDSTEPAGQTEPAAETGLAAGQETVTAGAACDAPFAGSPEEGLPAAYPEPEPKDLTVGLLNPNRATEVLTVMYDAARSEIEELGGTAVELDAKLNPDLQVSQFEQLLSQKVDAIGVTALFGPNVLGPLLEQAAAAGVPVVALELTVGSSAPVPGIASQVWQQRDRIAYLQVKAAWDGSATGRSISA